MFVSPMNHIAPNSKPKSHWSSRTSNGYLKLIGIFSIFVPFTRGSKPEQGAREGDE